MPNKTTGLARLSIKNFQIHREKFSIIVWNPTRFTSMWKLDTVKSFLLERM